MTNQDIETFFAVLDHGTMTAAAEALYITQPSLSARLKSLEDQVGAPLFHRGKGQRRITLTDAGQHFLPLARRWQNLLSETQTFAAAEKREFLHVIAAYTANQYILPPVYQRFLERELPVNLWVESMRTDQAVSAVARGDADMAIVDGALHYDLQIEAKPLFREGFFLVVPKTVALTEPVEATTLHVQDEILIYGQPEILQWHDYWYGVDARPLLYTDTPQLAETLPACGKRWSIIPAGATEPYLRMFSNVQVLRLAHPPAERTFYLVTPKGRALSAAAETLLETCGCRYRIWRASPGIEQRKRHTLRCVPFCRFVSHSVLARRMAAIHVDFRLLTSHDDLLRRFPSFPVAHRRISSLPVAMCRIPSYPRRSWPRISRVTASASHPMAGRRSMACP